MGALYEPLSVWQWNDGNNGVVVKEGNVNGVFLESNINPRWALCDDGTDRHRNLDYY